MNVKLETVCFKIFIFKFFNSIPPNYWNNLKLGLIYTTQAKYLKAL